jgi:hypothetical protein
MTIVDLRNCLESWPYHAEANVRTGHGADGREIILVRCPMGLEQYEVDGRPDGRRVHGEESLLDFHRARIDAVTRTQPTTAFELTSQDCAEVFEEASAFYHRLIVLFRLKDWTRVERDAVQVLCLLEFARLHARCAEDRAQLEPWRPHITRIQAVARAMILLEKGEYRGALQTARESSVCLEDFDHAAPEPGRLAEALRESARSSLVARPAFHPHEESSFVRQDDYWAIRYHGQAAFLRNMRGLECLAFLLRTPGREFHVSELLASVPDKSATAGALNLSASSRADGAQLVVAGFYGGTPVLDRQAKAQWKRRLHELREEMEEAERFNDPHRAAKARDEMSDLARHLASAVGLGGRDRTTSSDAERARSAVTKRLKQAVQKVAEALPPLGHHFAARIKTGYFCSYNPHPDRPVTWRL